MRPLLTCHGALMQPAALSGLGAALGREVIAPGLPAHRGGPAWDDRRDYHDQAFEAVLRVLPEAPVDVFGHSFGGTLGLRLAVEYPARVARLALFEPVLFAAADPAAQAAHAADMARFDAALAAGRDGTAGAIFHGMWGAGERWEDVPAPQRKAFLRLLPVIPATAPGIVDDGPGVVPKLADCPVPVLVMQHSAAPAIVASISAGLAARLPDVRLAEVAGRGRHMMPVVDPDAVAGAIRAAWG